MSDFALNLPLNQTSFGQVSTAILREVFKRGLKPCIFPIGQGVNLGTQKISKEFHEWLKECIEKSTFAHSRNNPIIKLWHLNGGMESLSKKQILITFYELDQPTKEEINIVKNNDAVVFTSNESAGHFRNLGCDNVSVIPLGFDKDNFYVKNREYSVDGRIIFNLLGKLEKRKNHAAVIKAWIKKYGNNPKYFLNCAIFNPFLVQNVNGQQMDRNGAALNQILEGKKYFNVQFSPFIPSNEAYNDFLNIADIVIGMSGAEGFDLPVFQSLALGKHSVVMNAHVYKDWADSENSVLVNPNGKQEAYDGIFFHKGQSFNQGSTYSFDENEFLNGCEKAIERVKAAKVNKAGLELQNRFTYEKMVDGLLKLV